MNSRDLDDRVPKFYGATVVGERGQMVVPAEARKDLNLTPSTKLMVFSSNIGDGLLIIKAESVSEMLAQASRLINGFETMFKSHVGDDSESGEQRNSHQEND